MASADPKVARKRPLLGGLWKRSVSPTTPAPVSHILLHDAKGDHFFMVPILRPVKPSPAQQQQNQQQQASRPQYARVGSIYVHFHAGAPVRQVEVHMEKDTRCLVGTLLFRRMSTTCTALQFLIPFACTLLSSKQASKHALPCIRTPHTLMPCARARDARMYFTEAFDPPNQPCGSRAKDSVCSPPNTHTNTHTHCHVFAHARVLEGRVLLTEAFYPPTCKNSLLTAKHKHKHTHTPTRTQRTGAARFSRHRWRSCSSSGGCTSRGASLKTRGTAYLWGRTCARTHTHTHAHTHTRTWHTPTPTHLRSGRSQHASRDTFGGAAQVPGVAHHAERV